MSEPQELMEQPLEDGAYLSPTQLDVLRTRNADVKTPADQIALLALLDSFVASNNRRDEEYRQLFDMAQKVSLMNIPQLHYPESVASSLPILFGIAYFDLLVLVGVVTTEDILEWEKNLQDRMRGVPVPKA
jgi:hypothetical protein